MRTSVSALSSTVEQEPDGDGTSERRQGDGPGRPFFFYLYCCGVCRSAQVGVSAVAPLVALR